MTTPRNPLQPRSRRSARGALPRESIARRPHEARQARGQPRGALAHTRRAPGEAHRALGEAHRALDEAREQQAATSEILGVISRSPADTRRVFEIILENATRLCNASLAFVMLLAGGRLELAARTACTPAFVDYLGRGLDVNRETTSGRAVLEAKPVQLLDFQSEPDVRVTHWHRSEDVHSILAVPLLRDRTVLGVVTVWRREVQAFPANQVALLQSFAHQAVIALDNMRLLNELETRTTQLARTVDQLQALGEVGEAVSSTLDLDTVLKTVVSRVNDLAGMEGSAIYEYEELRQEFRLHATDGLPGAVTDALRAMPMARGEGAIGRLASTGEAVAIDDIAADVSYQSRVRELLLSFGYRSLLAVPLLRKERLLGGLVVSRRRVGGFDPHIVDLLKRFATQSALAIQNARLYRELEEKGRQLELASRHKSAFLASMSHELRTPLNAIIGFTRIVMRHATDRMEPKQNENLAKILASGQHLLTLIDDILDLAKVEAGRVDIRAADVALAPLLDECLHSMEPLLREGVALVREQVTALPLMHVDEEKLRQIVINLLSNAMKFTKQGRIALGARCEGEKIRIVVADTGIGIAADDLERIFGEFEQARSGGETPRGGTGLGLAIARRLARLMGGDVEGASEPGAGSTFTLTLPLRYAEAARSSTGATA